MSEKCANCGKPSGASVNGRAFCNDPKCIDAVIRGAVGPVIEAVVRAIEADSPAKPPTDGVG
jgi:hypothetical protein